MHARKIGKLVRKPTSGVKTNESHAQDELKIGIQKRVIDRSITNNHFEKKARGHHDYSRYTMDPTGEFPEPWGLNVTDQCTELELASFYKLISSIFCLALVAETLIYCQLVFVSAALQMDFGVAPVLVAGISSICRLWCRDVEGLKSGYLYGKCGPAL